MILGIKRKHFVHVGHTFDYELEDGTMLHESEWNGEKYITKEGGYRPIQVVDTDGYYETVEFEYTGV